MNNTNNKNGNKSCKGCIWYSQCAQAVRCGLYDGVDDNEDNYVWSEMAYNENIAELEETEELRDIYEEGDMEDWFATNSKLS